MQQTILILGATGMLGAPVARRLQADGVDVRLLARDPDKARARFGAAFEVFAGDVTDCDSLERALEGCDAVHISVGGAVDQLSAENIARLASRFELERISYVSGSTVFEQNSWFPMVQQKLMAEKAVRECGVPYTIFCPTWPMEQLPRFVRDGRAMLIGELAVPLHWFAADDFAAMVSNAYQCEEAVNQRFFVHGPEAMTMKSALERYCRVLHPEIDRVTVMPIVAARTIAAVTGNPMLKFASDLMAYFKKVSELGDPSDANRIFGAPETTLDAWLAQKCLIEA